MRKESQCRPGILNAKQTTTVAIGFLDWLAGRGRRLETATQADLDAWYASGPSTREHVTRFLGWARDHKIITLDQPTIRHRAGPVMSETERLDHLNRLLDDPTLPVTPRLIGLLVLLFGQPLSRIIRIPRDAVTVDDELVTIRLGQHPLTLPPDIAMIIREHLGKLGQRRNQAGHPDQRWLFPGLHPASRSTSSARRSCSNRSAYPPGQHATPHGSRWSTKHQQPFSPTHSAPNAAPSLATPDSPEPSTPATPAPIRGRTGQRPLDDDHSGAFVIGTGLPGPDDGSVGSQLRSRLAPARVRATRGLPGVQRSRQASSHH